MTVKDAKAAVMMKEELSKEINSNKGISQEDGYQQPY